MEGGGGGGGERRGGGGGLDLGGGGELGPVQQSEGMVMVASLGMGEHEKAEVSAVLVLSATPTIELQGRESLCCALNTK